jgi:histidinol phosphatase-like PHP family hydrolase
MDLNTAKKSLEAIEALPFGARFYKLDFHFHTPASEDARGSDGYAFNPFSTLVYPALDYTWEQTVRIRALQENVLKEATAVASRIVDRMLEEGLSVVAITDHNALGTVWPTPEPGEGLRMDLTAPTWYELILTEAERRNRLANKTILTILAGVEISTTGVHILAVFPPTNPRRRVHVTISDLLMAVGLEVEDFGRNPRVGKASVQMTLEEITRRGGMAIIAHIDGSDQALLDLYPITSGAMKNVLTSEHLSAVEVVSPASMMRVDKKVKQPLSQWIDEQRLETDMGPMPWVQGSDAHALAEIGKRFTYVKMSAPSFDGVRAAFQSPSSRLRLGGLNEPTSLGLYLYGVELKSQYFGQRFVRFNRHLNCVVGHKECGKSAFFGLLRKAAHGGTDVQGEARLLVDFRDENKSQLYCFESDEAGNVSLYRFNRTGTDLKIERIENGSPEWDSLRPKFFDEDRANRLIASLDEFQGFLNKYLGEPSKTNQGKVNPMFDLPAFLSNVSAPLIVFEAKDNTWQLSLNVTWRMGKPELVPFEKLTRSLRRVVLLSILLLTNRSGPLLIDEPGDQFDNEDIVTFLVPLIRQLKDQNQMLFATGNSNLAINADPDNYVVIDTDRGKFQGIRSGFALDNQDQRQALVTLMEGSLKSYRARGARYQMR